MTDLTLRPLCKQDLLHLQQRHRRPLKHFRKNRLLDKFNVVEVGVHVGLLVEVLVCHAD